MFIFCSSCFTEGGPDFTDTFQNSHVPYELDREQSLHAENCNISELAHWLWISGKFSVLMCDQKHFYVSDIPWPILSPNFFLWRYLKKKMHISYMNRPHTQCENWSMFLGMNFQPLIKIYGAEVQQFCELFKTMCCKLLRPPSRHYLSKIIHE